MKEETMRAADRIQHALDLGLPVYAAGLVLDGRDAAAQSWREALEHDTARLALPEAAPEYAALQEMIGRPPAALSTDSGVFALGAVVFPSAAGDEVMAGVRRVGFVQGQAEVADSFSTSVANGVQAALTLLFGPVAEAPPVRCVLLRLGEPALPEPDVAGGGAGLAAALTVFSDAWQGDAPLEPQQVAAAGEVDPDGGVHPVKHLIEKLEGLIREGPFVRAVCIPAENQERIPAHIEARLRIIRAATVAEAVAGVWPAASTESPEPEITEEARQAALALPIGHVANPRRSFFTRLIYPMRLPVRAMEADPAGWRRFTKVEWYRYLSKLEIDVSSTFRRGTEGILVWRQVEGTTSLPLIYELDLDVLRSRLFVQSGEVKLRVTGVDLIPFHDGVRRVGFIPVPGAGGYTCFLGLRLEGEPCTVEDYLRFISQRNFSRLVLDTRGGGAEQRPRLGGVVQELRDALTARRPPSAEAMGASPTLAKPYVSQYLLLAEDQAWPAPESDPAFEAAWRLLATCSRVSPRYPKGGQASLSSWIHGDAVDTRYGVHAAGITALAHAGDTFNRDTKPQVFSDALYLQWLVARQMVKAGASHLPVLSAHREDVRRAFFDQCVMFFARQMGAETPEADDE